MTSYPTPHQDKLLALLNNHKLPSDDKYKIEQALKFYQKWIEVLNRVIANNYSREKSLKLLVKLLNIYKLYIEVNVIFDSTNNFLYRQKGQLKLDNTILEEFLPRLLGSNLISELENLEVDLGPMQCFSSVYFQSSLDVSGIGGGMRIRTKNQDFAISKPLYLKSSHSLNFEQEVVAKTNLAYLVVECKTNLDKTMFQEGCATARDLKSAVPGAKYYLLCEWLDMTPISTAPTNIDQVIILRKAKRISSHIRKEFSTFPGRQKNREFYLKYLKSNPLRVEMFERLIYNIRSLLNPESPSEEDVLSLGYF
ncbi:MAG: Bpu10I family restriction endonuclease [Oscillatoria sp. PMC 1068.18]|nr:Bpu10I family restriction endonuclease [Oscillatoria sp. PMC 1068.18]